MQTIGSAIDPTNTTVRDPGPLSKLESGIPRETPEKVARGLGWFSIGLGLAEIFTPGALARAIGIKDGPITRTTMLACGAREIMAGIGILSQRRPRGFVWARVAGDAVDLALLGNAMSSKHNDRDRVAVATAAVSVITLLDVFTARGLDTITRDARAEKKRIKRTSSVTINRPETEVARIWESMRSEAPTAHGEIRFTPAPGGRGTEVRLGHGILESRRVEAKLRRLKQLVEIGEVVQSDASIHKGPHPGRPSTKAGSMTSGKDLLR
jgi:hypothetical protein